MHRKHALTLPALLAALALLLGGCTALLNDGRTVIEEDPITVEGGDAVDRAIDAFDAEHPPQERYYYYKVPGEDPDHPDIGYCGRQDPPAGAARIEPGSGDLGWQQATDIADGIRRALGYPDDRAGWHVCYTPAGLGYSRAVLVTQNPVYTCLYGTPADTDADTNPNALNGSESGGHLVLELDAVTGATLSAHLRWSDTAAQSEDFYAHIGGPAYTDADYAAWAAGQNAARTTDPWDDLHTAAAVLNMPAEGWQASEFTFSSAPVSWQLPAKRGADGYADHFSGYFENPSTPENYVLRIEPSTLKVVSLYPQEETVPEQDAGYYQDFTDLDVCRWVWYDSWAGYGAARAQWQAEHPEELPHD